MPYTNADWSKDLKLWADKAAGTVYDLSGVDLRVSLRPSRSSNAASLLDLTTANGGLVIADADAGIVRFSITRAQAAALGAGSYVGDLIRVDGLVRTRLFGVVLNFFDGSDAP